MQTNGVHCHLGSIHLAKPGLYIAIHQAKLSFPRNFSVFANFKLPVTMLINIIYKLERTTTLIRKSVDRIDDHGRNKLDKCINPQDETLLPCQLAYNTRPTFYHPPNGDYTTVKLSINLFGVQSLT